MPESERLQVLRQQRALMQQQLALIDRQIALEAGAPSPASSAPTPAPTVVAVPPVTPAAASLSRAEAEAEAEALLAKLIENGENRTAISKGRIWMAFLGLMLCGASILYGLWFFFYRNR
jgi:hypothetical protein